MHEWFAVSRDALKRPVLEARFARFSILLRRPEDPEAAPRVKS